MEKKEIMKYEKPELVDLHNTLVANGVAFCIAGKGGQVAPKICTAGSGGIALACIAGSGG